MENNNLNNQNTPLDNDFVEGFNEEIVEPPKRKKTIRAILITVIVLIFLSFTVQSVILLANITSTISEKRMDAKSKSAAEIGPEMAEGKKVSPEISEAAQAVQIGSDDTLLTPSESKQLIPSIVKTVSPSIVTINNIMEFKSPFGQFGGDQVGGTGSGIIVKADKKEVLIATNFHVVEGNKELEVILQNGDTAKAKLLGYNSLEDIAVLSVKTSKLETNLKDIVVANLGDSDKIEVGEMVIAIGNPLGSEFSSTVTSGIISALGREINFNDGVAQNNLIQTDAAINPGNSGGALLNLKGEVIGINNGKYVAESVEGIGFAIPINDASNNIKTIIAKRNGQDVSFEIDENRPMLGVTISDIDENLNYQTGLTFGVYVKGVSEGSGAYKAGIKAGDVIYGINNITVKNTKELFNQMSKFKVGDIVKVDILRENELLSVDVELYSYGEIMNK